MRIACIGLMLLWVLGGSLAAQSASSADEAEWFQWRGDYNTGVAPAGNPPLDWSEDKNIKWKSEIPGIGNATPIIRGDQIILLSAVETGEKAVKDETAAGQSESSPMSPTSTEFIHRFTVISVNRMDGKIQWQTIVKEELPHSSTHQFGSWASNSPLTDGEKLYAYFGSHGLYCLDFEGKVLWERDLGRMEKVMNFGEGSSPVVYKDKLIVLRDHQGKSTLLVLDKHTGETVWEKERDEGSSWSTPLVLAYGGKDQVITSASKKVRSYNLQDGEVIWECSGLTGNVIPSPVYENGLVYVMSGFRGNALLAIDLSKANGEITDTDAIVFKYDQNTPYTPGPVLMDGKLYFLKANNGYLTCLDARDGTEYYANQKLESIQGTFSSPLGVSDRIYIASTSGACMVVKAGEKFEILSQNQLEESFLASPVVVGNKLYLRGKNYLYCIAEQ